MGNRVRRCSGFAFRQIAPGDLDIPVIGQLPVPHLPLGDQFEPGPMKMIGFEAPFGRRSLCQQVLEDAAVDAHDASVFADLDAEFDGHPIRTPPGILGKCEKQPRPPFGIGLDVRSMF
jgi:hypothetical protein